MKPTKKDLPKVAIIGRPNVGKSSLFNRMIRQRKAIIESVAGVTRDRIYAKVRLGERDFILIDTGGMLSKPKEKIAQMVYRQSKEAIDESDLIIFTCDATSGLTYQDDHIAKMLLKSKKTALLVVNKIDSTSMKGIAFEFYKLGLGRPYGISVIHGSGLRELYKDLIAHIPATDFKREKGHKLTKIAIVGKPNVGKSSLINCILDKERLLVDSVPGTTRDSVDITFKRNKNYISIVDTAGVRHKKKIKETVDMFSLARTKESIKRSDVAIIMIDATTFLHRDDISVIEYVVKNHKPCILLVNKWDLLNKKDAQEYKKRLDSRLKFIQWIPTIFTSCIEKHNILRAIDKASKIADNAKIVIQTAKINKLLEELQHARPHHHYKGVRPKIFYGTQISATPQKFMLFCSYSKSIKPDYLRFLENSFRKSFSLEGIPIAFELKERGRR